MEQVDNEIDNVLHKLSTFKNEMLIENWENFQLDFSNNDSKEVVKIIKSKAGIINGFYAVFDKEKCLYIGIGRPIWKRIKSHYYAALGKEKIIRWSEFFQKNNNSLTIYYKEFNFGNVSRLDDKLKMLIESVLEHKYKPSFEFEKDNSEKTILNKYGL